MVLQFALVYCNLLHWVVFLQVRQSPNFVGIDLLLNLHVRENKDVSKSERESKRDREKFDIRYINLIHT